MNANLAVLCPAHQFRLANVRKVQFKFGSGPPNLAGGDPAQTELQGHYPPKCRGLTHDTTG